MVYSLITKKSGDIRIISWTVMSIISIPRGAMLSHKPHGLINLQDTRYATLVIQIAIIHRFET